MIGTKFGKWLVVAATEETVTKKNLKAWLCKCECGKIKKPRAVSEIALKSGKSRSCGKCTPWRTQATKSYAQANP